MRDNLDVIKIITYEFEISGGLSVADDQYFWVPVPTNCCLVSAFATAKTAPVGSDVQIEIEYKRGVAAWATAIANTDFVIGDGNNIGYTTAITVVYLEEGDMLRININQVGSGTAGSDLYAKLLAGV